MPAFLACPRAFQGLQVDRGLNDPIGHIASTGKDRVVMMVLWLWVGEVSILASAVRCARAGANPFATHTRTTLASWLLLYIDLPAAG